jgi:thiamine pyrophosphokinase
MSSHHIIREKQEPALIIMSLEGFDPGHLGQILEWSPTVIVHEDIYELADSLALKVDFVISGDPDFITQENTHIILTESDHLQDALKYLTGENYHAVNIIARDFSLKDYALFVKEIGIVVFIGNRKLFPVRSGFSKWQPVGEQIEILHEPASLRTNGLLHKEGHLFETIKDGFYSLVFDQPFVFIAEKI